jgi:hypothetical protein
MTRTDCPWQFFFKLCCLPNPMVLAPPALVADPATMYGSDVHRITLRHAMLYDEHVRLFCGWVVYVNFDLLSISLFSFPPSSHQSDDAY